MHAWQRRRNSATNPYIDLPMVDAGPCTVPLRMPRIGEVVPALVCAAHVSGFSIKLYSKDVTVPLLISGMTLVFVTSVNNAVVGRHFNDTNLGHHRSGAPRYDAVFSFFLIVGRHLRTF
jgi:hypothetical protein